MTDKVDLFKQNRADYIAPKTPQSLYVGAAHYLTIEGHGAPNGEAFQESLEALYGMAYTIKMTRKRDGKGDYIICKLEARWWHADGVDLTDIPQHQWHWQLLIRTPSSVQPMDLEQAAVALVSKGKSELVKTVSLSQLEEGDCIQLLHTGPYEDEGYSIEILTKYAQEIGAKPNGCHHEIYISDPRRVPPERLKTILRQPVSIT